MRLAVGMALIWMLAAGAVACGGDSTPKTDVTITLTEWEIGVEPASFDAGEATFELTNAGDVEHNFVIVKSDLPPAELSLIDGAVDTSKLKVVTSAEPLAPGATMKGDAGLTVDASPGKYVFFCDLVTDGESHYRNGMYASVLVEP